jgi:hypothetical protein
MNLLVVPADSSSLGSLRESLLAADTSKSGLREALGESVRTGRKACRARSASGCRVLGVLFACNGRRVLREAIKEATDQLDLEENSLTKLSVSTIRNLLEVGLIEHVRRKNRGPARTGRESLCGIRNRA